MKAKFYQCPVCEERYVARQECLCGTKPNDLIPVYDAQHTKPQIADHQPGVNIEPKKNQSALRNVLGCIGILILIFLCLAVLFASSG